MLIKVKHDLVKREHTEHSKSLVAIYQDAM